MKIITKTERLYLREFTTEDAIHFYKMNLDNAVIKYTGDNAFNTEDEAYEFLSKYNQYTLHKMGRWAVCDKKTDAFLGWSELKYHPKQDLVEVGYRFYKAHWNNGYATESVKASIQYGFNVLKLKTIYAHAHINNMASHKVIEKCGLKFIDQNSYNGMPVNLYKIENPDIEIKQITAAETYPVRQPVLRVGRPIEDCIMEADDLKSTFHFGLFYKKKLVGVSTFMIDKNSRFSEEKQYRLRGMAVLKGYQGFHFGKHLLQFGEDYLKTKQVERVWFNARIKALNFYKNNDYKTFGTIFDIPDIGSHYVMSKTL